MQRLRLWLACLVAIAGASLAGRGGCASGGSRGSPAQ